MVALDEICWNWYWSIVLVLPYSSKWVTKGLSLISASALCDTAHMSSSLLVQITSVMFIFVRDTGPPSLVVKNAYPSNHSGPNVQLVA